MFSVACVYGRSDECCNYDVCRVVSCRVWCFFFGWSTEDEGSVRGAGGWLVRWERDIEREARVSYVTQNTFRHKRERTHTRTNTARVDVWVRFGSVGWNEGPLKPRL